jgi:flagellar basal-body rod modification protein FlgD
MSDLVLPIKDGKVADSAKTTPTKPEKQNGSELGKDEFLQLLVAQMKYQDPLNPNTDTQYVSQLATFSQLEQMQNLNQTTVNSQAFNLIGADVIVKSEDSSGKTTYKSGTVDYVTMSSGKAQLSINGNLYTLDQLYQVIDGTYLAGLGIPSIKDKVELTYDKSDPQDLSFDVDLGSGDYAATDVAIKIGDKILDTNYVTLDGNKVIISKDALKDLELPVGKHDVIVGFNNYYATTIKDKVTLTVTE